MGTIGELRIEPRLAAELAVEASPRLLTTAITRAQLLRGALQGLTATQAAVVCKCSAATARHVYADPSFKAEVLKKVEAAFEGVDLTFVERKKTTFERIQEYGDKAFDELISIMEDTDTHKALKVRVATNILDRIPETRAGEVHEHHLGFDPEQLSHAAKVAREMDGALAKLEKIQEVK